MLNVTASAVSTHSDSSEYVSSEAYCAQSSTPDSSSDDDFSWIADSGATEHMSDKRQWFTNFHPVHDKCWSVSIADDHLLYVRGVGDIIVHATINGVDKPFKLQNVLYRASSSAKFDFHQPAYREACCHHSCSQ